MEIYSDDTLVGDLTAGLVRRGHRVFQIFKFGPDADHVRELLAIFDLPRGAYVLDAGCGIGEVARLMKEARPDLGFALLNISRAQLGMCPSEFLRIHGSFENVPAPCETFDGIMFNYSLGHGTPDKVFSEAARLLKPGGIVLVYDIDGDEEVLGYRARPMAEIISAARQHGLEVTRSETASAEATDFLDVMEQAEFAPMFRNISPVIYRFVKC